MRTYLAKSSSYDGHPVSVREHNLDVAYLARLYGEPLHMAHRAELAGLLHDFGKYGELFADVLSGEATGIDHAGPGAALLYRPSGSNHVRDIIEAVAGHHGGLVPLERLEGYLRGILTGDDVPVSPDGRHPSVSGKTAIAAALDVFQEEVPGYRTVADSLEPMLSVLRDGADWKDRLGYMLAARYLMSCLVDADWSASAFTESGDESDRAEGPGLDVVSCMSRLEAYRDGVRAGSRANPSVNSVRDQVYRDCGIAGDGTARLMTLTAPTGSAKTLGMLHFALRRMARDSSKRRIIIVLPYLTLTNQVADVVKQIFPDVLVDTSQNHDPDVDRSLSSRWTSPVTVTTTVQFFGSLFSNRTGDLRKVHRISDAVVLFDEVQSLPHSISLHAMQALRNISEWFNDDILLSTATQPAYASLDGLDWAAEEVIRDVPALFGQMPGTGLAFDLRPVPLAGIAREAAGFRNSCVIVNLKRHAMAIHDAWLDAGVENVFLLSTQLCPAHRRHVIEEIRRLQSDGKTVHVVSTQCIEAGVDLDFEQVFRALAPLPSLVQSAGRQNRNGRYAVGNVRVFVPEAMSRGERLYPGDDYERQAVIVKRLLGDTGVGDRVGGLDGIRAYYEALFSSARTPKPLEIALNELDYEAYARESRLIRNSGLSVVVPYDKTAYLELLGAVHDGSVKRGQLAGTAHTTVQSYDRANVERHCAEVLLTNRRTGAVTSTGTWILLGGHEGCYRPDAGLVFDGKTDDVYIL